MAPAAARQAGGSTKPRRKRARKIRTAVVSDSSSSSLSSSSSSSSSESGDESGEDGKQVEKTALPLRTPTQQHPDDSSEEESSSESSNSDDITREGSSSSSSASRKSGGRESVDVDTSTKVRRKRFTHSPPPQITTSFSDGSKFAEELSKGVNLETICREMRPALLKPKCTYLEAARQKRREAIVLKNERKAAFEGKQSQTVNDSATREDDFKALWMRLMVDEFGEELNAIRKVSIDTRELQRVFGHFLILCCYPFPCLCILQKEPTLSTEGASSRMPLLIDALQAGSELFSRGGDSSFNNNSGEQKLGEIDEVGLMLWLGQQKADEETEE